MLRVLKGFGGEALRAVACYCRLNGETRLAFPDWLIHLRHLHFRNDYDQR